MSNGEIMFLHLLPRFNVAFSVNRFLRDFPEFRWEVKLEEWTLNVVEWNERNGKIAAISDEEIFDDRVIASWQKCMELYDKE
jgi:hypothetical protein